MNTTTLLSQRYLNKVCLVTGGTRGIGLATAQRFLQEQARAVIICSSKEESVRNALKQFKGNKRIEGYQCDVTQKQQRVDLLKKINEVHGQLDVMVLN